MATMTLEDLMAIAKQSRTTTTCPHCQALVCKGWASVPGGFDLSRLTRVGSLRDPDADEPTLAEHHPNGTGAWSDDAPIALGWFPYNRCDVWQCSGCARPFLRYTEVGGYYTDERIRELQAHLIVRPPPNPA
jgi:ribosomal protein L37AE/L43A